MWRLNDLLCFTIFIGYSYIKQDMKFLVQALIYRFQSFISIHTESLDHGTFQYLASMLKYIHLVVISFTKSNSNSGPHMVVWDANVSQYFTVLFNCSPLHPLNNTLEKLCSYFNANVLLVLIFPSFYLN
jgi:hypothetical protein